jgi:hypothetical protein
MKTNTMLTSPANPIVLVLGILAAALVFMVMTGRKVPLLSDDRAVLLGLIIIGVATCSQGILQVAAKGDWFHPLTILGYILGAAILIIGTAAVFNRQIPPLTSYSQAFIAVAIITAVKMVITIAHRLFL